MDINKVNKIQTKYFCVFCNEIYESANIFRNHHNKYHPNTIPLIESIQILTIEDNSANINNNEELFLHKLNQLREIINFLLITNNLDQKTLQYIIKKLYGFISTSNNIDNDKIIKSYGNNFIADFTSNILIFYDKFIKFFYYNDQVYFKAKDIALMLDYSDYELKIVDSDDKIKINELLGSNIHDGSLSNHFYDSIKNEDPKNVFINESGFYSLILASKNDEAKKFKKWIASEVLPSIRKNGNCNFFDNYYEDNLDKYINKDCVYILHIKDNIYKYGNTSHIIKRLQAHKKNLNYNKIIKIYDFNNMNFSKDMENKIKKFVKSININIQYGKHVEIFQIDNINLNNIITKIDKFKFDIINKIKIIKDNTLNLDFDQNLKIEEEKTKQLELQIELYKLSGKIIS